jgi:glycosyltransferase involved in cell wall biosynthesis
MDEMMVSPASIAAPTDPARPRLSAVLITLNAASVIEDCLTSIQFADEIIVVDSGSTDGTIDMAEAAGAKVVQQAWLGFGPQKQFAVEQAQFDWVLCIDADERVSPALRDSIIGFLGTAATAQHSVARFARCNRFLGRYLRHGEGYPDWNTRLFHRAYARWAAVPVHEYVETTQAITTLAGDLLHHSQESLAAYIGKQNRYTSIQAERLYEQGKHLQGARLWLKLTLAAPVRFVRFYVLRLGFLDGLPGFAHIAIGSFFTFVKYAKLLALQIEGKK